MIFCLLFYPFARFNDFTSFRFRQGTSGCGLLGLLFRMVSSEPFALFVGFGLQACNFFSSGALLGLQTCGLCGPGTRFGFQTRSFLCTGAFFSLPIGGLFYASILFGFQACNFCFSAVFFKVAGGPLLQCERVLPPSSLQHLL